jgi:SAM-dependent methyltransferase
MLTETEFTDADWMKHLHSFDIPDLNEWMRGQAARGQDYYRRRLRRLRLNGGRVLDAGCGVGNWTIALAASYEEVVAVDNDPIRLGILEGMRPNIGGRIIAKLASVEQLPLEDASLDAVFCYGVIFVTDFRKSLGEFARVLKPGGRLYITYNGKGWWRHLIHDRGGAEPECITYGANGLISRYFMLLDELVPERTATEGERKSLQRKMLKLFPARGFSLSYARRLERAYAKYLECDDDRRTQLNDAAIALWREELGRSRESARERRQAADALACADDLCAITIPTTYRTRMAKDLVSRFVLARSDFVHKIHTYAHEPEEMTEELVRHGFHSIESAHEGCLCLDAETPLTLPIQPLGFEVFESLALR